jgi:hypothetical protein
MGRFISFLLGCVLVVVIWSVVELGGADIDAVRRALFDEAATGAARVETPADRRRNAVPPRGNDMTEFLPGASLDEIFAVAAGGRLRGESALQIAGSFASSPPSSPVMAPAVAIDPPDSVEPLATLNDRLAQTLAAHLAITDVSPAEADGAKAIDVAPRERTDLLRTLLHRGDAALDLGDIASARGFYARGADLEDPRAMEQLALTLDPLFLEQFRGPRVPGDPARAAGLYRRAAAKGLPEAERHLARLVQRFPEISHR